RQSVERARFLIRVPLEDLGHALEPDERQIGIGRRLALRAVPASFPPGHRPSATQCTPASEDLPRNACQEYPIREELVPCTPCTPCTPWRVLRGVYSVASHPLA